jgi:hypothetical protein
MSTPARQYLIATLQKSNAFITCYKAGYLYFRRVQLALRIPILLCSTALTFGSFGSSSPDTPRGLPWIIGSLSLCVSILTGVENFLKPSETMQQCRSTFLSLLQLKHSIEQYLATGKPCFSMLDEDHQSVDSTMSTTSLETTFIQSVFDKFTQIMSMAPILSHTQETAILPAGEMTSSTIPSLPIPPPWKAADLHRDTSS